MGTVLGRAILDVDANAVIRLRYRALAAGLRSAADADIPDLSLLVRQQQTAQPATRSFEVCRDAQYSTGLKVSLVALASARLTLLAHRSARAQRDGQIRKSGSSADPFSKFRRRETCSCRIRNRGLTWQQASNS